MDTPEVRLTRLLFWIITLLLNHNESLYQVRTVLGTHVFRLCASTDPVVHSSKQSGLGQMWVQLVHFLQQSINFNPFMYCEVKQDLRCEESEDHPKHLGEKATGGGVTFGGYVEVQSAPYTYDQGAEAYREDPKSAPLL